MKRGGWIWIVIAAIALAVALASAFLSSSCKQTDSSSPLPFMPRCR